MMLAALGDNDPYLKGYEAGFSGSDEACPHLPWLPTAWLWRAGHVAGNAVLCAQLDFIFQHFPES